MGDRRVSNMFNSGMKNCPRCQSQNHINADYCPRCNHQFSTIFMQQTGPGQYSPHPAHGFGKRNWVPWVALSVGGFCLILMVSPLLFALLTPGKKLEGLWICQVKNQGPESDVFSFYDDGSYSRNFGSFGTEFGTWSATSSEVTLTSGGRSQTIQYSMSGNRLDIGEYACLRGELAY